MCHNVHFELRTPPQTTLLFLSLPECGDQDVRTALLNSCPFVQHQQIKTITVVPASREYYQGVDCPSTLLTSLHRQTAPSSSSPLVQWPREWPNLCRHRVVLRYSASAEKWSGVVRGRRRALPRRRQAQGSLWPREFISRACVAINNLTRRGRLHVITATSVHDLILYHVPGSPFFQLICAGKVM